MPLNCILFFTILYRRLSKYHVLLLTSYIFTRRKSFISSAFHVSIRNQFFYSWTSMVLSLFSWSIIFPAKHPYFIFSFLVWVFSIFSQGISSVSPPVNVLFYHSYLFWEKKKKKKLQKKPKGQNNEEPTNKCFWFVF